MAEEPQILKAKKSSKGFLIKDKDSGQKKLCKSWLTSFTKDLCSNSQKSRAEFAGHIVIIWHSHA